MDVQYWRWRAYDIPFVQAGTSGLAIVLVHGFGASWGHWRKNIPTLGQEQRVFALDLLGYGGASKPSTDGIYTFETWGQQVADFIQEVVKTPTLVVGNSIGAIVALQSAQYQPLVIGVTLINCSLRLLHQRKRLTLPWFRQLGAPVMQNLLAYEPLGRFFFERLATPQTVRAILKKAYYRHEAITEDLVAILLEPSRDPAALAVFLAFITYDTGPIAEDLLRDLTVPVQILWGEQDPWEPIALGRAYEQYPVVKEFIPIPGAGHCPQDEVPDLINPLLARWAQDVTPHAPQNVLTGT
jgi:pimeloyl-ACP methyl ester carboxylesterase